MPVERIAVPNTSWATRRRFARSSGELFVRL